MWEWLIPVIIVMVLLLVLGTYLWVSRRNLVHLQGAASDSFTQVTEALQSRAKLLPGAVSAIEHYAANETGVFSAAQGAQQQAISVAAADGVAAADSALTEAVRGLEKVAAGYPQLLSSPKYLQLQTALSDAELQSQSARRLYNAAAREVNARASHFPGKLFAKGVVGDPLEIIETAVAGTSGHGAPRIQF